MQGSDDCALRELDLERGARDGERITERGLRRGLERSPGGGCAAQEPLGLESPPRNRPDAAECEAGAHDRAVCDRQGGAAEVSANS